MGVRGASELSVKSGPRSRLSASYAAVCRQGIYVEYSVEYSKCCGLNGKLVSTVVDSSGACVIKRRCLCGGPYLIRTVTGSHHLTKVASRAAQRCSEV
eukprot:9503349-Pyramimonas_sp.AAC.1